MFHNPGRSLIHIRPEELAARLRQRRDGTPLIRAIERMKEEEQQRQAQPAEVRLPVQDFDIPLKDDTVDAVPVTCETPQEITVERLLGLTDDQ